ncbi:MAG TPA: Flp pilus assembly protein CpaB [Polyangiaceae bacterium]|nr:Flp pilus assembly protein CpaB [Polyangiaceae bacterium]
MNRRILLIALLLASAGLATFVAYVRRFELERSGGEPVQILIAKDGILRGKVVTEEMLAVRSVPVAYVEDRSVKAAERDKVLGLRIVNQVAANQAVMWSDFNDLSDEPSDLSSKVEPGFRAVYVSGIREAQGSALIRPGDLVDVISTMAENSETRASKVSVVVLQKVVVLANGVRTSAEPLLPDVDDKHAKSAVRDQGLTLALSLQQAQSLAVAGTRGFLSIALRSRDDERTFANIAPVDRTALLDPKARAAVKLGGEVPPQP